MARFHFGAIILHPVTGFSMKACGTEAELDEAIAERGTDELPASLVDFHEFDSDSDVLRFLDKLSDSSYLAEYTLENNP